MLIRFDNPRLVLNAQEFPAHIVLMYMDEGSHRSEIRVEYVDGSTPVQRVLRPTRTFEVFDTLRAYEIVLPFQELHDPMGARAARHGFRFHGSSSYLSEGSYHRRDFSFHSRFSVIGGGILTLSVGNTEWDLATPTFDPRAPIPEINQSYGAGAGDEYISGPPGIDGLRVPDEVIRNAYHRTHSGRTGAAAQAAAARRAARLADFDLKESLVDPTEAPKVVAEETIETPTAGKIVLTGGSSKKGSPKSRFDRTEGED